MNKRLRLSLVFLISLMMSGCGLSPVQQDPVAQYTLSQPKQTSSVIRSRSQKTILVSMPVADPAYASSAMTYMRTPFRVQAFARNRWVAPPSALLAPIMANAMRGLQYFKAVIEPPFSGRSDYNLQTQLHVFQQNFQQPVSRFIVSIQASLVNNSTNQVVASKRFYQAVPAAGNDPFSGVLAANKAVIAISHQMAQFVRRSI